MSINYVAEPFRIKMVELIKVLTPEERLSKIKSAKYNLFKLNSEDVYIDLITDSGTNAMSANQWSAMMNGDEAYAGSRSYYHLINNATEIFGYDYIQPVHQGRAAEKVLLPLLLSPGKYAISNFFFDTTRAHVELAGARAIDCIVKEANDLNLIAPFKGNMDVIKMEEKINEIGKDNIGVVVMTITNNSAGGQPVSIENMEQVSKICKKYNIPLCIDAARFSENAYFIKQREAKYKNHSIKEITRITFSYADMFTMSAKKDLIVNMGGLIGIKNNSDLVMKVKTNTISYEGFITYGGLNGRDLEAMAIGLNEGMDEDFLEYRIGQIKYLADAFDMHNIPYQKPYGGHGIFIDARSFFPQIPHHQFPAQALSVELYLEAGIRTCDIGSFMLGNDPDTQEQLKSQFEFTRLAIPRRVYTQSHLDIIIEALVNIKKRANSVNGYRINWEPKILRHFQAELEPIE